MRRLGNIRSFLVAALALAPGGAALAQRDQEARPDRQETPPVVQEEGTPVVRRAPDEDQMDTRRWRLFAPRQLTVAAGAGVLDYAGNNLAANPTAGAAWDVRLTWGTRSLLAVEAAYIGAANTAEVPGRDGVLVSNGVQGDLRINLLPYRVQPYVFGGLGYNRMTTINADNDPVLTSVVPTGDSQMLVPAGLGLSAYPTRHVSIDVRGAYRAVYFSDIMRDDDDNGPLNQWLATANLGYVF